MNAECLSHGNGSQTIRYHVQYQNEGEAPTKNVLIMDNLSSNFDPGSLQIVDSSFPCITYQPNLSNPNQVIILFEEIYLNGLNEPPPFYFYYDDTKGYVTFDVCTYPGVDDCIENMAEIYFTGQPAIETNTAVICLAEDGQDCSYPPLCAANVRSNESEDAPSIALIENIAQTLKVFPNPTNGAININFSVDEATEMTLNIMDSRGRSVVEILPNQVIENGDYQKKVSLHSLSAGLYFLQMKTENTTNIRKIVVTN